MRTIARIALALFLTSLLAPAARAVPAGLDPSFGAGNGFVRLSARRGSNGASAIVQQADGKYVVAGSSSDQGAEPAELSLTRLLSDGSRDTSFGESGVAYLPLDLGSAFTSLAIQSDGKFVMGGVYSNLPAVFRVTADGRPDSTFGTAGVATVPLGAYAFVRAIQLQADGAILAVGDDNSLNSVGFVARLLPNGAPDPSWDGDGIRLMSPQPWTELHAITLIGGTPLIVGESSPNYASSRFLTLIRLTATGAYDTSFDGDGIVFTTSGLNSGGRAVALQTSNTSPTKIVVAGYAQQPQSGKDFLVARYSLSGALDATFDGDGILLVALAGAGVEDAATSVRVLYSGATPNRIIAGGNVSDAFNGLKRRAAIKLFLAGTFDTAFDGDGILIPSTALGTGDCAAMLASGGRIVFAGTGFAWGGVQDHDAVVSRHSSADGTADAAFGSAGWRFLDTGHVRSSGFAVALQPDGKVLVGGRGDGMEPQPFVRRLLSNGTPDSTFGDSSVQDSLFSYDSGGAVFDLALQNDGRILAAGVVPSGLQSTMFVARMHPNGALDRDFAGTGVRTIRLGDSDSLFSVAVQPDGRILLAGVSRIDGFGGLLVVARLRASGVFDSTFGAGGNGVVYDYSGLYDPGATQVTLLSDGRILVVGRTRPSVGAAFRVVAYRLLSNGAFDATWNGYGKLVTPVGYDSATPTSIAPAPNDGVIVSGYTSTAGGTPFVLRFLANGTRDSSFGGDGELQLSPRGSGEDVHAMAVRPSGHVVLAGTLRTSPSQPIATLARIGPDGSLDTSFGTAGHLDVSLVDSGYEYARDLAFDAQGRAVAVGGARDRTSVFRLLPEVVPTAVGDGDAPRGSLRFGAPSPNPTRGGTSFVLHLPAAGMLDVAVHDVSGRRVRSLRDGVAAAGPQFFRWDGRDAEGHAAQPGLYFIRARAAGQSANTRVVLVH